jgi:hypothetical protein
MRRLMAAALLLASASLGSRLQAQLSPVKATEVNSAMAKQSSFYCNAKALSPSQRAHHKALTEKLVANRTNIVETVNGFEFQFSRATVSINDLAEWSANESKCCPFFDFHIELEREGKLLCLRLTGPDGIKTFIRAEFGVPSM